MTKKINRDQQILYITGVGQLTCLFDPSKNSLVEQKTLHGYYLMLYKNMSFSYETSFQGMCLWFCTKTIGKKRSMQVRNSQRYTSITHRSS